MLNESEIMVLQKLAGMENFKKLTIPQVLEREKLIELVGSTEYGNGSLIGNNFQKGFIEKIADHLIANGVTVQKWIPVTERLPEKDGDYIVYTKYGVYEVLGFAKDGRKIHKYDFARDWKNVWYSYESEYGYFTTDSATHWMPLPPAPEDLK